MPELHFSGTSPSQWDFALRRRFAPRSEGSASRICRSRNFNDLIDVPEGIEGDELFEWEAAERMEFDQCFGWYRDRVEDQL
jgi:hypothetical protein